MKKPRIPYRMCAGSYAICSVLRRVLFRRRQIGTGPMRYFRCHADALAQGGMGVDGLADVHCICAHLDGQCDLADHAAAEDFAHACLLGEYAFLDLVDGLAGISRSRKIL
jgi:hypothetical protein